jgi:hypothetical protein
VPSDWLKIRHWNGSQNLAFEELCCQLAHGEPVPEGSRFTRKGTPDAGVECFWQLPNGDEWAWQAKFFVSSLSDGQWAQLSESVSTALEKHPRLKKYTICVPLNFSDARVANKASALDKWNKNVGKWVGWVEGRGMSVDFVCWNESLMLSLLSKGEHRGRRFFWFNEEVFSYEWFKSRIEVAGANAGPRYTPELNVELPIARNFDGLGRTVEFYNRVRKLYGELRRQSARCFPTSIPEALQKVFKELEESTQELLITLGEIKGPTTEFIPFDRVVSQVARCRDTSRNCEAALDEYAKSEASKREEVGKNAPGLSYEYRKQLRDYGGDIRDLLGVLRKLQETSESKEAQLANLPALLIVGDAGIGKTHLLCDVARKRLTENRASVLFLGEQFTGEEPWAQMIKLVGLNCTRDDFLGALDAAGAAFGGRVVILIDALNEGEGSSLWPKHLAGILTMLSRYKWVALAITVRSSYESSIVPTALVPGKLIRIVHEGFSDNEYQAMQTFFDHFGIEHPSVPLLAPEFQNPLFLKIFCQALKNLKLSRIPAGLTGITQLLNFFLDSINRKLAQPDRLDFDPKDHPVNLAISKLAQMMAARGTTYLLHAEARDAVNAVLPREGFDRSLFRNLISEGLLAEERFLVHFPDRYEDIVRFAYERFTDHLIAKHLLESRKDGENAAQEFVPDSRLGRLFEDEFGCWRNKGLLEAICVQVPERFGSEVPELLTHCASFEAMRSAFVDSLVWRNPSAITEATLKYLNEEVIRYKESHGQFLNVLLTVATYPEHPYNSRFLHRHLWKLQMADRDAWWSIFLHEHYGEGGAVDRLIDWAWFSQTKSRVTDDSSLLASIALAWFLTSSNRYLRDRATKALVSLLTSRIQVLRSLLLTFRDVNDLYVAERTYAVAYGCALRSTDSEAIVGLAQDVYDAVFSTGQPAVHVLLRDYARGIIDVAFRRGAKLDVAEAKIKPPYKSKWPARIPSAKQLEKRYGTWYKGMPDDEVASLSIFHSVMDGDFGRYVIGTNFGRREFSSCRRGEAKKPTYKQRYDAFLRSLTKLQKAAFKTYEINLLSFARISAVGRVARMSADVKTLAQQLTRKVARPSIRQLRSALGERKYRFFVAHVLPYLKNPSIEEQADAFDLRIAQGWILKRVLDLGWTAERFGRFDRHIDLYANRGREEHKSERLGKKYQWIAYHELLALLLDNFEFRGDSWGSRAEKYDGLWQAQARDIDPSIVITKTAAGRHRAWWAPQSYEAWDDNHEHKSWIADPDDLPDPRSLLVVVNPKDGSRWITLEGWYFWEQPVPPEEERFENEHREIWNMVRCYLTRKKDTDALFAWAAKQNFMGRWMPENHELYRVFLGEFSWAPAFNFHDRPYYGHEGWTRGPREVLPAPVLSCTDGYLGESSTRDCSVADTIHITVPAKLILEGMSLEWNGVEGHFFDTQGKLVAFDPSVGSVGPRALLIREEAFVDFLRKAGCDLLWTVLGEKQIIGGHMSRNDWKGRLEVSGAFRRSQDGIEGHVNTRHVAPR